MNKSLFPFLMASLAHGVQDDSGMKQRGPEGKGPKHGDIRRRRKAARLAARKARKK